MKKKTGIILLTIFFISGVLIFDKAYEKDQVIFLNEVRSWDASVKRTGYFGSDYIEIYNASGEEISLEGWFVSDDAANMKKSRISGVVVEPKGYALLYANEKNDTGASLNFKLNSKGEKIFLSDANGSLVDSVYVPEQKFGTVYGRKKDGSKEWCIQEESTAHSNDHARILPNQKLQLPVFSHAGGFYDEEFILTLEADKGEKIYYTMDGSIPTEDSLLYEEGILIKDRSDQPNVCNSVKKVVQDWKEFFPGKALVDKAQVIRAIAVDQKGNISDVATNTYFIDLNQYQERNVISIVAEFEDMFGEEGIFITGKGYDLWYLTEGKTEWTAPNFLQSGRRWEIQGNLEIFEKGKNLLNHKAGIRTQGASTRLVPKKRMSIFSREEYSGSRYFQGIEFQGKKSHAFSLNSSAANVILPELVKDRKISVQDAVFTTVFLNGEYWYDAYAIEKYNKDYLQQEYHVNPDNVMLIKNQSIGEGPDNSYDIYAGMLAYVVENDLSVDENYRQLEQMVDMQSYIDYMCSNIYFCNMDISEIKNYILWRAIENDGTEMGDGRWRWMLYDTDCVEWINCSYYGVDSKAAVNSFADTMQFTGTAMKEHTIYRSAKNNEKFRKQFVLTFLDMANVNFSMENVEKVFQKWDQPTDIYGNFFKHRAEYIIPYMAEELALTGTLEDVTLKVNDEKAGKFILNTTTPDLSTGSWTGKYYTDYPITVTAVPEKGYQFIGWSGSVTSDHDTIEAEVLPGGITLEAVFEKIAE